MAQSEADAESRTGSLRFWGVVKANISPAGRHREGEFNEWYNREHVPEWASKPGFVRAWRLHALEHTGQEGRHRHAYYAIYELESVAAFNEAIARSEGAPWGPWQQYVGDHLVDWERTYYRVLCAVDPQRSGDGGSGADAPHWAIVKTDFEGSEIEEREFNRWYDEVHLPELVSHEGFEGAWRLRVQPDEGDLGERGQRYWAVYRVGEVEQFLAARRARAGRGLPPWDGLWKENLRNTEFNFYELLHQEPSAGRSAPATGAADDQSGRS